MTDVMIVDDQAPFRAVAGMLVRVIDGWTVVAEAASGEEAVERAIDKRPAVVLMDINLPGISGLEATRRIVERLPGTRVVLVSTYTAEDLPGDARDCGAVGYIRKEEITPVLLREVAAGPGLQLGEER